MIPLLQPRKAGLSTERLSVYLRLGKQAFCQGDWIDAGVRLVDLAGHASDVEAKVFDETEIGLASDSLLGKYVKTYVEAKKAADRMREDQPKKKPARLPMDDIFEPKT